MVSPSNSLRLVPGPKVHTHTGSCPSIQDRITCEGFKRVDGSQEVELSLPRRSIGKDMDQVLSEVYPDIWMYFAGHLVTLAMSVSKLL